jgi:hypothetical protein
MDPQRLVQRPIERGAVVAELLPKPLLRLSIDLVGRRGVGPLLPLLQVRCGSGAQRRGPCAVCRAPQLHAGAAMGHESPR